MKLPHFRLKNVVNIKAWIALRGGRTWLKRQGRQRAADEIVSTSFLINLVMLVVMGMQAVSEGSGAIQQQSLIHSEVTMWCLLSRCGLCGLRLYENGDEVFVADWALVGVFGPLAASLCCAS